MASRFSLSQIFQPAPVWAETEFARRIALARQSAGDQEVGKPAARRLFAELDVLAEPARRVFRRMEVAPARSPQTVLILPGFAAHPRKMRYFARQLERAGHTAKRWGQGRNWGPTPERFDQLEQRLLDIHDRAGEPIALVGWSLGGVYARELANRHPHAVSKVISMGSPFSGNPRANNVWRAYQFITGHPVDAPPIEADVSKKPPVETIALWGRQDSVISSDCAAGRPGERDRAIAVNCTHMGFTYSPEAIATVLKELDR
ncbi:MAG: alpha/beta fold hydrolase [Pseudomonadota bacterium]|nr:alpha/beta fold hydrolase [Pseudomonadota bacterium]